MRKLSFLSAAVLVSALYSCSSDESATAPSFETQDLVPVELGLATNSTEVYQTRGTGTVGDTSEVKNIYNNEDLYVLMTSVDLPTWGYSTIDSNPTPAQGLGAQFDNTFKCRPIASGIEGVWTLDYLTYAGMKRYYPVNGSHSDFFAYYIDDAADNTIDAVGPNGDTNKVPEVVDGTGNTKILNFTIDGSQDILAGKAELSADQKTTYGRGFNAKTARAGIIPRIPMKHLLTRFTFSAVPGDVNADGLEITAIKIVSKTKGVLTVAYDQDGTIEPKDLIAWDDASAEALSLQERVGDILVAGEKSELTPLQTVVMNATDEVNIGDALFVNPEEEEYKLVIEYRYPYIAADTSTKYYEIVDDTQTIKLGNSAKFAVGNSYHVRIKVYGLSEIKLETTLEKWVDGGVVEIDTADPNIN